MKILFVSHDASRTGAPKILLDLIAYTHQLGGHSIQILFLEGGDRLPDFAQLGRCHLLRKAPTSGSFLFRVWARLLLAPLYALRNKLLLRWLRSQQFDLVYANTAATGHLLPQLKTAKSKVICHLHEMHFTLQRLGEHNTQAMAQCADHFVVVSRAVQNDLLRLLPHANSSLLYEFIQAPTPNITQRESIRKELGIPPNAFVIGGSGNTDWRKGADLFAQLAIHATNDATLPRPVYFVWVGQNGSWIRDFYEQLCYDLQRANALDFVRFTGLVANPHSYYQVFDAFALTSREDPFPLVFLENLSMGTPVCCFAQAGGAEELLHTLPGAVVPYSDTLAMWASLKTFLTNRPHEVLSVLQNRVNSQFTAQVQAPKYWQIVEAVVRK